MMNQIVTHSLGPRNEDWLAERLAFEVDPENAVLVPLELASPHRLVAAAAKEADAERTALHRSRDRIVNPPKRKPGTPWRPDLESIGSPNWHSYEGRGHIMELTSSLPLRVSIESIDRALRIWDAILKACEARGMRVSSGHRVVKISVGTDHIGLRLSEKVDVIKPKTPSRGYQPAVRRPTGCLRLFVVDVSDIKFEDTPQRPLETQLNDVLARIYRAFALQQHRHQQMVDKRQRDEETAQARERARAAEAEAEANRAEEAERQRLLVAEAVAWRDAETIRAYVLHLKAASTISSELAEWLSWADAVADELDPTLKRLR